MSIIYPQFNPVDRATAEDCDWYKIINLMTLSITEIESKRLNVFDSELFDHSSIGTPVSEQKIQEMYELMLAVAVEHGYPESDKSKRVQSDKPWAVILHQKMGITRNEASKGGIWNALSCHYMPNLVAWRWPNEDDELPEDEAPEIQTVITKKPKISRRWLTQDNRRHAFSRLWWRAELLHDDQNTNDPYHILNELKEYQLADITERPGLASFNKLCLIIAKNQIKRRNQSIDKKKERKLFRDGLKLLGLRISIHDIDALDALGKLETFAIDCLNNTPTTI